MKNLSVLIKPSSSLCNAKCEYCFYEDVATHRSIKNYGFISETDWKLIVEKSFDLTGDYQTISFVFQGGEPLLSGIDFYQQFVAYSEFKKGNMNVLYIVQTNGTLLNDEFCDFFSRNKFLVGISIDGFEENHDKYRSFKNSKSFELVFSKISLLRSYGIEFNIITVLTKNLAHYADKLFSFYEKNDFKNVQIIPCLPDFGKDPYDDEFSLTPELFSNFYTNFFDLWLESLKKGYYISENLIDNVVNQFLQLPINRCGMNGMCQRQCVIEADGSIYPCDFYVTDTHKLGDIRSNSIGNILRSKKAEMFRIYDNDLPNYCHDCEFLMLCGGNCKRLRPTFLNENYCGYKNLLVEIYKSLDDIQLYISEIL